MLVEFASRVAAVTMARQCSTDTSVIGCGLREDQMEDEEQSAFFGDCLYCDLSGA